ncbi:MAG: serine hydrolase domain-containing protein [Paracoccaceae bacterium]
MTAPLLTALALSRPGHAPVVEVEAPPSVAFDADTMFRAASISKLVTGAALVHAAGAPDALDADLADVLGPALGPAAARALRHPSGEAATLCQVAGHTAGLTDDGGYLIPQGMGPGDWLAATGGAIWSGAAPGARFEYCNLGYLLLGLAVEVLSGRRFDHVTSDLLRAWGAPGGFGWSGVPPAERARALAAHRPGPDGWQAQIDAQVPATGIVTSDNVIADESYRMVHDTARLSPQGGLRTSLTGLLAIAAVQRAPYAPPYPLPYARARPRPPRIDGPGGVNQSYELGVQTFDTPDWWPGRVRGHFGNAYGTRCAAFADRDTGATFAYVLTGTAEETDELIAPERRLLARLRRLAAGRTH